MKFLLPFIACFLLLEAGVNSVNIMPSSVKKSIPYINILDQKQLSFEHIQGVKFAELSDVTYDRQKQLLYFVSDKGLLYSFKAHFSKKIDSLIPFRAAKLKSKKAKRLKKWKRDSEGLALDGKGRLLISFEGDVLENPWAEAPEEMYVLTVAPEDAPDQPEYIDIEFEKGDPVAINGERLSPANLLAKLNELGGKHGIGRVDLLENRYVGMKSRGVYETPGGTILEEAHRGVEQITMDREVMNLRDSLVPRYAAMIYNGYWFAPERIALQALIDETQKTVNGKARIKLYKGHCRVVGRDSATDSLFNVDFATFEADDVYNQADAEGFIKLSALRLRIAAIQRDAK